MFCARAVLFVGASLVSASVAAQTRPAAAVAAAEAMSSYATDEKSGNADDRAAVVRSFAVAPLTLWVPNFSIPAAEPVRRQLDTPGRRERTRMSLYGAFATLQMLDVHSTRRALAKGGRELNPLMAPITGNVFAFGALKVGVTALTIRLVERLRIRNPATATAVMVGLTSLNAVVVASNYKGRSRK